MTEHKTGPVLTLIEFTIDQTKAEAFHRFIDEVGPGTRSFPGNLGFSTFSDPEDSVHVVHQVLWDSLEAQQKYMEWRESTGVFDAIRSFIVEGPRLTYWYLSRTF